MSTVNRKTADRAPQSGRAERLIENWVYGGFLCSFVLLAYTALLPDASTALLLVYAHLPAYMWHQYEEHDGGDGFRNFFNRSIGGGLDVLTPGSIFFINVYAVWALFAAIVVLAFRVHVGWGLGVAYLSLLNAFGHVVPAIATRRYNPGMLTAVAVFFPLAVTTIAVVARSEGVTVTHHLTGVGIGLGAHAAIVAFALTRRRHLAGLDSTE